MLRTACCHEPRARGIPSTALMYIENSGGIGVVMCRNDAPAVEVDDTPAVGGRQLLIVRGGKRTARARRQPLPLRLVQRHRGAVSAPTQRESSERLGVPLLPLAADGEPFAPGSEGENACSGWTRGGTTDGAVERSSPLLLLFRARSENYSITMVSTSLPF